MEQLNLQPMRKQQTLGHKKHLHRNNDKQSNVTKPRMRYIKSKVRDQILNGLSADYIDPQQTLLSLQSIQDPFINQVKYYIEKACEICSKINDEANMLLCDRCDDAYHLCCLVPPMTVIPEEEWVCTMCSSDILKKGDQNDKETKPDQKDCFRCGKDLCIPQQFKFSRIPKGSKTCSGGVVNLEVAKSGFSCRCCNKFYHVWCLNERVNALNCTECQQKIRKKVPKSYKAYTQFIKKSQLIDNEFQKHYELLPKSHTKQVYSGMEHMVADLIGLQLPKESDNPYVIIKAYASLCYALNTQGVTFFDEQIYPRHLTKPSMNRPDEKTNIRRLHPKDEQTFKQFKMLSRQGFFGLLEITESKTKGFYVKSIEEIPARTILCEYAGEVISSRHSLTETNNDCIFGLLNTLRSNTSLDICPTKYGNLSKFICGINNVRGKHKENVQSLQFLYQGSSHVIFFTKRLIKAEETLYVNYNAGGFHEYPTEHFEVD